MNYDKILLKIIYRKDRPSQKFTHNIKKYPNIVNYLVNRFEYVENYKESLDRLKFNIPNRPTCKKCGGIVKYVGKINGYPYYRSFCSCKCSMNSIETKQNLRKVIQEKYGVDNVFQNNEVKEKIKSTWMTKYHVDNPRKSKAIQEKSKSTSLEKYGTEHWISSGIVRKHIIESNLRKYGVKSYTSTDEFKEKAKETCLDRYGVEYYTRSKEFKVKIQKIMSSENIQQKINCTKRKNHTFNTSKPEEELYLYIKEKFPSVKRQYKDKIRYPYNCDFYIPELDYFIELQGYYTHGKHPFDPTSIEDLNLVKRYKEKYGSKCQVITIWTIKDVEKRNCAKEHNLSFKEVWTLDEGKHFVDKLYNKMST